MLFAFATGDGATVARIFYDNSPHTRDAGLRRLRARDRRSSSTGLRAAGLGNLQLTLEIGRIFDILRRHRIQARSHMTMVNLALMTAEGLGKRLAPELSLTDEALPYLAEALGPGAGAGDGLEAPPASDRRRAGRQPARTRSGSRGPRGAARAAGARARPRARTCAAGSRGCGG